MTLFSLGKHFINPDHICSVTKVTGSKDNKKVYVIYMTDGRNIHLSIKEFERLLNLVATSSQHPASIS